MIFGELYFLLNYYYLFLGFSFISIESELFIYTCGVYDNFGSMLGINLIVIELVFVLSE